jgi:hypothetical protein
LIKPTEWDLVPPSYYTYKEAINKGINNPLGIDNYAFETSKFENIDLDNST